MYQTSDWISRLLKNSFAFGDEAGVIAVVDEDVPTSLPAVPKMTHPRPQAGSVSFKPSQENSAHAEPSRAP